MYCITPFLENYKKKTCSINYRETRWTNDCLRGLGMGVDQARRIADGYQESLEVMDMLIILIVAMFLQLCTYIGTY